MTNEEIARKNKISSQIDLEDATPDNFPELFAAFEDIRADERNRCAPIINAAKRISSASLFVSQAANLAEEHAGVNLQQWRDARKEMHDAREALRLALLQMT